MSQPANDVFSQHLSDDEASYHEDASDNGTATNKPKQQQQLIPTTTTISNIKLLILKKEEYDIWAMEMEHYLEYIDNDVWKVIQNGNSKKRISTRKYGVVRVLSPVSAVEIHAVEKEMNARTILLMAIPKEHLRRFHGMNDAKEIWKAIRTRFGGNANSKKMQKAVLKQQFEAFTISSSEGLEKGYDRFQQLLSQLEAHGAEVSTEDANHKFLRSLPLAWSNLAMTMRTKPDVDTLSIDDLYNNLRVFEQELTSTSKSSAKREVTASFADEVIYLLFAKQSEDLDLLHEDLEQIDDVDIEEMDINWQIAMIAIRMRSFTEEWKERNASRGQNVERTIDSILSMINELGKKRAESEMFTGPIVMVLSIGENISREEETNMHSWHFISNNGGPQKPETSVSDDKFSENSVTSSEEVVSEPKPKEAEPSCVTHAELKKQRVFNTGNGVAKPVWNNANRVNHANHFVPRPVQLNTGRENVNTGRANVNSVRANDHPLKNMEDRGIFDSGCSGHMTGNKDHLDDFEECKGGSVTFGGSKGYITGKGRIRVGNLEFDSVSFVKELGHFNLFSISQICDKQHKVLFTETECLVVSPDFKMPDETQILLKVPRQLLSH
ncbi:hypothetical protein Tco_0961114 [Tanacetum coccineum]